MNVDKPIQRQQVRINRSHFCRPTVTHEGKVILFGAAARTAGKSTEIYYTVRRDGFETSTDAAPGELPAWENWKGLPLLEDQDKQNDPSVTADEKKTLSVQGTNLPGWVALAPETDADPVRIYQSLYSGTRAISAAAPVQVVSALGHIYTFRQSTNGTILADRFVLDGLTNNLIRKLDVRFKRSRQRLVPQQAGQSAGVADGTDYRDANGLPFYEPSIQLNLMAGVLDGNFAVVFTESAEPDLQFWHFFTVNNPDSGRVDVTSIAASSDGLFDVRDDPPRDGILRRSLILQDASGGTVTITGAPAAIRYDRQKRGRTRDGQQQLLRESVHVMLAVPTDDAGLVTVTLAITGDGTLAGLLLLLRFDQAEHDIRR